MINSKTIELCSYNESPLLEKAKRMGKIANPNELDKPIAKETVFEKVGVKDYFNKSITKDTISDTVSRIDGGLRLTNNAFFKKDISDIKYDDFKEMKLISNFPKFVIGTSILCSLKYMEKGVDHLRDGLKSGKIKNEIKRIYDDPRVTAQLAKELGTTSLEDIKDSVRFGVDTTYNAIKASDYLVTKLAVGVADAVQSGVKFVGEAGATIVKNPEMRNRIAEAGIVEPFSATVNKFYDESNVVMVLGDALEKIGETGTKMGVALLATGGGSAAVVGVGASSLMAAGDYTDKVFQKYGDVDGKAMLIGTTKGVATGITETVVPILTKLYDIELSEKVIGAVGNTSFNVGKNLLESGENVKQAARIGKAASTGIEGAFVSSAFHVPEFIEKLSESLLKSEKPVSDRWSELGKKTLADASIGSTLGIVTSYTSDVIKDMKVSERLLTKEEKIIVRNKCPGITDANLNKIRLNNEKGNLTIQSINQKFDGKNFPGTDVKFNKKSIKENGLKIDVVAPEFKSHYSLRLPENKIMVPENEHFRYCNKQLKDELLKNPELKKMFNERQLAMIDKGLTPSGYTWHHDVDKGIMQLVDTPIHRKVRHTGGNSIWNGGL